MIIALNLYTLSLEKQKEIYLALKEKFENPPFKDPPLTADDLLNSELDDYREMNKHTHIFNILKFSGIHTVRQLTQTSKQDLTSLRGFGKRSLEQVEDFLQVRGLSLKN